MAVHQKTLAGQVSAQMVDGDKTKKVAAQSSMGLDAMSTTVGGESAPSTMGNDTNSDNDDLITESSGSSRMSRSRTAASRCKSTKVAKREAFLLHCKQQIEATGGVFKCTSKEEFKKMQQSSMVVITEEASDSIMDVVVHRSDLDGLNAADRVDRIKEVADVNPFTLAERIHIKQEIDSYFSARFVPLPTTQASVDRVHKQFMTLKDGHWWCSLCDKWGTDPHIGSTEHNSRLTELASGDEMIGIATSKRRFESTPGLMGPLSRKAFRSYWGSEGDARMGDVLRDRMTKGTCLEAKLTKRFTRKITLENIISHGLSVVSYPGAGKYGTGGNEPERAVRWEDIKEYDDTILSATCPRTFGWWPALIVQWAEQHADHGFTSRAEYYSRVMCGTLPVYVVCWYQLVDGTWSMVLWPIFLTSRL